MTVTLQIGNTDNRLTQSEWSDFCSTVRLLVESSARKIHFDGCAAGDAPRQNACWVFTPSETTPTVEELQRMLVEIRQRFRQDAVAWSEGETRFL